MNSGADEPTSIRARWLAQQRAAMDAEERAFWRMLWSAAAWGALAMFGGVAVLMLVVKLLDLVA